MRYIECANSITAILGPWGMKSRGVRSDEGTRTPMNLQEAKFLLAAYRPNGADAGDPQMAAALALARADPELAAWFTRQRGFDAPVGAKLNSLLPPAELRDAISAGMRFHRPRRKWSRVLLMAAAILVLGAVAMLGRWRFSTESRNDVGLVMFATNYAANGIALKTKSGDTNKLKNWLVSQHAPMPERLPLDLATLRSLGCRTLNFQGHTITLICFEDGREFHLFVVRRRDFPAITLGGKPLLRPAVAGWCAASWMDADHVFVLVSDASPAKVKLHLRSGDRSA